MQISLPRDFPAQAPKTGLPPRLNQKAQALFDDGALGRSAAVAEGVAHQLIVDVDICAHNPPRVTMCKNRMFVCMLSSAAADSSFQKSVSFLRRTTRARSRQRPRSGEARGLLE
jgi:hypothetical protein